MFAFKYIELNESDRINSELNIWLDTYLKNRIHEQSTLQFVDLSLILSTCPTLSDGLNALKVKPISAGLVVIHTGDGIKNIHTDGTSESKSIVLNVGIRNTRYCDTVLYNYISGEKITKSIESGHPYNWYGNAHMQEIGRYSLFQGPALLNTHVPHAVHNPTNLIRYALSIRFEENPWNLIYESDIYL